MINSKFRTRESVNVNIKTKRSAIPQELYKDFYRLGLTPGASLSLCKSAQRNLMKKHHPDKHAKNCYSLVSATKIASTINEAFQRIEIWYTKGKLDD